jgi:prevent-host-death family protein
MHLQVHTLRVKTATAKDLRLRTATVLDEVRRGHEVTVTYRGQSIAVLVPIEKARARRLKPIGFGMWRDRRDMRDVRKWVDERRRNRFGRSSSIRTS